MSKDPTKTTDDEREAEFEVESVPLSEGEPEELKGHPAQPGALDGESMQAPRLVSFDPQHRLKGRLFSLKNNRMKKNATHFVGATGRSFNYEDIYDEDAYGEEAFPDARVWKVYNDEAQLFDLERMEAWRDAIDVLLVFIGLFAAVVSAFLIETSKALQPDYAQLAVVVSFEILRSLNNSVLPHATFSPNLLDPKFGEATKDHNLVNTLWYTSLAISLSTALLAMLVKQWLHQYMTSTSGTARERARIRHFRFVGLDKYRVPFIIDLLPTLLHLALALFLAGLALYLQPLHTVMFSLVAGIATLSYTFYLVSIVGPLIDVQCPYKSPTSFYVYGGYVAMTLLLACLWQNAQKAWKSLRQEIYRRIWHFHNSDADGSVEQNNSKDGSEEDSLVTTKKLYRSLSTLEKRTVLLRGPQLDVDGIVHLYNTSANTDVRNIALEAFGGLQPSNADVKAVDSIMSSDLHAAIRKCHTEGQADNVATPGMERRHDRLLRVLCLCAATKVDKPYDLLIQGPEAGERDPRMMFAHWFVPWFAKDWEWHFQFTALFTFSYRQSFPLPVWATLIRLGMQHRPNDVVIHAVLVSTLHLSLDTVDMGAVPLERAMQNPCIRSIGLDYLGIHAPSEKFDVSLALSLIMSLLSKDNAPFLETTGLYLWRLSSSDRPSTTRTPHLLSSTLPVLFRSLSVHFQEASLGNEHTKMLRAALEDFFMSSYSHAMSWETSSCAIQMWFATSPDSIRAITTPSMIHLVLQHFRHRDYWDENDVESIQKAVGHLFVGLGWCIGGTYFERSKAFCSGIWEWDMLPLHMESQENTSVLHFFWSGGMCMRTVKVTYLHSTSWRQAEEDWFTALVAYLHVPERLMFLSSRLAAGNPDSLRTLCQIRPKDVSWPTVFKQLLSLFRDPRYLDSMEDHRNCKVQQPRRCLSDSLIGMKKDLIEHHPVLSSPEFDVPQFDSTDRSILGHSNVNRASTTATLTRLRPAERAITLTHNADTQTPSSPATTDSLSGPSPSHDLSMQGVPDADDGLDPAQLPIRLVKDGFPDSGSPAPHVINPPAQATLYQTPTPATASPTNGTYDSSEPPPEVLKQRVLDDSHHISLDMDDAGTSTANFHLLRRAESCSDIARQ